MSSFVKVHAKHVHARGSHVAGVDGARVYYVVPETGLLHLVGEDGSPSETPGVHPADAAEYRQFPNSYAVGAAPPPAPKPRRAKPAPPPPKVASEPSVNAAAEPPGSVVPDSPPDTTSAKNPLQGEGEGGSTAARADELRAMGRKARCGIAKQLGIKGHWTMPDAELIERIIKAENE